MTIRHILQSIVKYCLYCLAYCVWIESLPTTVLGIHIGTSISTTYSTPDNPRTSSGKHIISDTHSIPQPNQKPPQRCTTRHGTSSGAYRRRTTTTPIPPSPTRPTVQPPQTVNTDPGSRELAQGRTQGRSELSSKGQIPECRPNRT